VSQYFVALDPRQLMAIRLELFSDVSRLEFAMGVANLSDPSVARAERGEPVRGITAARISKALNRPLRQLFREHEEQGVPA
jgi:hypothetical protein